MALVLKSNQAYSGNPVYTLNNNILEEAVGIYSTQLIRGQYRGALIRVVNSNQEEMDIFPNSKGVIDANQLITFSSGGTLYVSTMYDQSGNGNNAKRDDADYRPVIVKNGEVIYNTLGIPSVKYQDARGLVARDLSKLNQSEIYRNKLSLYIDFEVNDDDLENVSRLPLTYRFKYVTWLTSQSIAYRPLDGQVSHRSLPSRWTETIKLNPAKRHTLLRNTYLDTQGFIIEDSSRNNKATVSFPLSETLNLDNITEFSIASAGAPKYNDKTNSFNGIINTVVVR